MDSNWFDAIGTPVTKPYRYSMHAIVLFGLMMVGITGCGGQKPPVSDVTRAREILEESLGFWLEGKTTNDLRTADPPTYISEDLWENQSQLVEYAIEDEGEVIGTNVCFKVILKTKQPTGKQQTHSLKYLVTTDPAQTIARLDL